ncbi:hypothetical protein H8356DRAFT_1091462, partial [Neocallimastix lanati (nom. inval.)]
DAKFAYKNFLDILDNVIENNSTLKEYKKQFEDLLKSFNINKNFTENYNSIKVEKNEKDNEVKIEIDDNKNVTTIEDIYSDTNDKNTLRKRSTYNRCFQYSLLSVNPFGKWNLWINSVYGKDSSLTGLYNRMDGCSIPDGIIGYIGKIFKPDLYNKAKYLFYNICNTHDMYYHCGDNYNTCNTILLNNPDITCRNEYSYSQYEYSDYEDFTLKNEIYIIKEI